MVRLIVEIPKQCRHPEHNPPQYKVYESGSHQHTCPGCGIITEFTVESNE